MDSSSTHGQTLNLNNNADETCSVLEVQIFNIDSHVAPPTSADRALNSPFNVFEQPLKYVPVIRIFGATRGDQRVCLHVHQAWPYMCVRYTGKGELHAVREFGYQLGRSLNHALNLTLNNSEEAVYIAGVAPVRGTPFYGYTVGYHPFLKIQFANPSVMTRASSLLTSGAVMGQRFEVFGAHLSYVMQFLVNNNLYGNGWIRLDNVRFRSPLPDGASDGTASSAELITNKSVLPKHRWVPSDVPSYLVSPPPPERISYCELEADTTVANIINRRQIRERRIHNSVHEAETDVNTGRLVHSLGLIWADENRRRVERGMAALFPADGYVGDEVSDSMHAQHGLQWSNHWKMQSLFESVLADDSGEQEGYRGDRDLAKLSDGSWLDAWPTCQEVDMYHDGLELDGVICKTHFYSCAGACVPLHCANLSQGAEQCASKSCSQNPEGISIDMKLVSQSIPSYDSDEAGYTSGASDILSDAGHPFAGALGNFIFDEGCINDLGGLDDIDSIWLEGELSKAEAVAQLAIGKRESAVNIPQLDGSKDNSYNGSEFSGQKTHIRECHSRRSRRRGLLPLNFLASGVSMSTVDADHGSSSASLPSPVQPLSYAHDFKLKKKRYSGSIQTLHQSIEPANHYRYCSSSPCRDEQTEQSHSKLSSAMLSNVELKKSAGRRFRYNKDDISVDIPHDAGSICKQRGTLFNAVINDSHAKSCAKLLANVGVCLSVDKQHSMVSFHMSGFFTYLHTPPNSGYLLNTLAYNKVPEALMPMPFFSDPSDAPKRQRTEYNAIASMQPRTIHDLPLFVPSYISKNNSNICALDAEDGRVACKERRRFMWSPVVIPGPGLVFGGFGFTSAKWGNGWWVFFQRPPNRLMLRENYTATGITQVHMGTLATPIQRRQRDQSDLKWSSVLGKLSQCPASLSSGDMPKARFSLPESPTRKRPRHPDKTFMGQGASMSRMALEILTTCGQGMLPDPRLDKIILAVACLATNGVWKDGGDAASTIVIWTCSSTSKHFRLGLPSHIRQRPCADELEMFKDLVEWVRQSDPDIMCGYDIHKGSLGYLLERAKVVYGQRLDWALSRLIYTRKPHISQTDTIRAQHSWSHHKSTSIKIGGRHVLNVWRLMRNELSLTSYTFEKVASELLGEQSPNYAPSHLATWFVNGSAIARIRAIRHVLYRAKTVLRMLDKSDVIERAVSFAMVIGIDFHSVLTRGSQLRVESLMARIAHPELYMLPSPTKEQVAQQRAAECLPLVIEPQSRYYTDPVVVLDFQSLYPSIIIAYNYCYSTCLGSLEDFSTRSAGLPASSWNASHRLGYTDLPMTSHMLNMLKDYITISPNGLMFVKPSLRKGLLGRMLQELIETRAMIKDAMKRWCAGNEPLHRKLDSWQLGLKLISNVTYGYVGASFSGRMPCVEIADAIVQSGRETLENAIRLIHSRHAEWGARVVYGDTDSLFLHMQGKSRLSAFQIGRQIAAAVTELNPAPVKLNFEKVYQPCMLLTKKRYMGWMFSSADQVEPLLDAKGMELVRRDGCFATQRILEGTIDTLFKTNDLSLIKTYIRDQFTEIMQGRVPVQEFIIAKETRMHKYLGRTLPAHAKVAADGMMHDPQVEPEYGERVAYLVVNGNSRSRLIDQVVPPKALLAQPHLRLNFQYYIDKQLVPALDRVLSLVGVDVRTWVAEMPRRLRSSIYEEFLSDQSDSDGGDEANCLHSSSNQDSGPEQWDLPSHGIVFDKRRGYSRTLDHFYHKRCCFLCRQTMPAVPPLPDRVNPVARTAGANSGHWASRLCSNCSVDKSAAMARIGLVHMNISHSLRNALNKCITCVGGPRAEALLAAELCDCLDCPIMFQRVALSRRSAAWTRLASSADDD